MTDKKKKSKWPECEKWGAVHNQATKIFGFLKWAESEKNLTLCELVERPGVDRYFPNAIQPLNLVYEFFEINPERLENERRAILAEVRRA